MIVFGKIIVYRVLKQAKSNYFHNLPRNFVFCSQNQFSSYQGYLIQYRNTRVLKYSDKLQNRLIFHFCGLFTLPFFLNLKLNNKSNKTIRDNMFLKKV